MSTARPRLTRLLFALGLILCLPGLLPTASAQEFNCTVSVNTEQLKGTSFDFLKDLEQDVREYFNNRSWTDDRFDEDERIDCMVTITFEQAPTLTSFQARLLVASRRPIYNATQNTTVLQFLDPAWSFNYSQGSPLNFNLEQYDPLTSVLDFYAFMMLGYDYDTFSELGGTPHFEQARRIAERAQGVSATGWSQVGDDRGRNDVVTQILDPRFRPLRQAYFAYHYGGLDRFLIDPEEARANVLAVLTALNTLSENYDRSYVVDVFFSAKYQELSDLFLDSQLSTQAYDILTGLDPAHMSEYNKLVQ